MKVEEFLDVIARGDVDRFVACWCDLESRRTIGSAIATIIDMQSAGAIPPPSALGDSGSGLWAAWGLDKHEPGSELQARVKRAIAETLERALGLRGSSISWDKAMPARVQWLPQMLTDGSGVPVYELDELARLFSVE